jgi:hypothetical protein
VRLRVIGVTSSPSETSSRLKYEMSSTKTIGQVEWRFVVSATLRVLFVSMLAKRP